VRKLESFSCVIIFICIYHVLVTSFCYFDIINFIAPQSVHVCLVSLYRCVVLDKPLH
jgi:hypothetical protein